MKLTPRETALATVFASLFGVLAGGGLLWAGIHSLGETLRGNSALAMRAQALQSALDDRPLWEDRNEWLNEHTSTFRSREDAAASLLNHIDVCATNAGIQLIGREILSADEREEEGGGGEGRTYFRGATIRVTVAGSQRDVLVWIHSLQQPERLIGVTGEVIDAGEEFTAQIDVTMSYFEGE